MKAHFGTDAYSGLVYLIIETAAKANSLKHGRGLMHDEVAIRSYLWMRFAEAPASTLQLQSWIGK